MNTTNRKGAQALTRNQQELITPELMGYAETVARKYQYCGMGIDDLKQEAFYGLCQAAARFDAEAGSSLKTFATFYIRKYVLLAIEQNGGILRVSREDRQMLKVESLDAALTEVAGNEGEEDVFEKKRKALVAELLMTLTPMEREAIVCKFGVNCEPLTPTKAARHLKVTPERLKQIFDKGIAKMRTYVMNNRIKCYTERR